MKQEALHTVELGSTTICDLDLVRPCDPPQPWEVRRRWSLWADRLEQARARQSVWVVVDDWMTESTAKQIASDLRSTHRRDPSTIRVRGVIAGERWETRWGQLDDDPDPSHFYVWLRWIGLS